MALAQLVDQGRHLNRLPGPFRPPRQRQQQRLVQADAIVAQVRALRSTRNLTDLIKYSVALYGELEPLIDDAYAEISPPGSRFSDRLDAAIEELLEVTPESGNPELKPKVLTYVYADESLEGLSSAQRQLLRMGPDNVMLIKAKLRDLQVGLQVN